MEGTPHIDHYRLDFWGICALFLSLACISIMPLLFGLKAAVTPFASLNYARSLVFILYTISWLFSVMSAVLSQTNNNNLVSCTISNFICILLYAASKGVIYLFLVERVFVVTSVGVTRWNSRMFKFNIALLAPVGVIIGFAIKYRVSEITEHGECRIGIQMQASVPLIVYDFIICIWLTGIFLRVLVSSTSLLQSPSKSRLRTVARRTFIGSILSLFFSTANIASLVAYNGHENHILCLALCTLDVTLNAVTIHWVTSPGGNSSAKSSIGNSNVDVEAEVGKIRSAKKAPSVSSHVSASAGSYSEEYHQLHVPNKCSTDSRNY